mmetsp:Transcript_14904/g.32485  ORF Transcript_14904/g.32485 Transcript_14904/m.32485 type:complete len:391 (-) Transcript_14904:396-1568(-)
MVLVIPLKAAVRFDLTTTLGEWLDNEEQQVSFQPTNPLQMVLPKPDFKSYECRDDLVRLASLRNCLTDVLLKSESHSAALEEGNALEDAMEYHATLLEFEKRGFPTLDDDSNGLTLKWKGAWAQQQQESHSHLLWDRSCITFTIVALLSFQAAQCSLNDRDECKRGFGLCQQAASILETLQELASSQVFSTVDLSLPMLQFWQAFLMAQGQSFVHRMASSGGKHATLSSLSQSAYQLYNDALSKAQDARLESEVPRQSKQWATYCKAQAMMAAGKAEYHQAAIARIEHHYGVEIVRLRQSLQKLQALQDFLKSLTEDDHIHMLDYTRRECDTILPVVRDRLKEIERDNHKIYNEDIPKSVPDIEAKQLIKSSQGYPEAMLIPQRRLFVGL